MKKRLMAGLMAAVIAVTAGIYSTNLFAQETADTFSVAIRIEYPSGFVYENVFARGVEAADLRTYLQACGQSHRDQNWLRVHCYVVAE